MSCEVGRLYAQGSVLAVSDQQREQINEILSDNKLWCSAEQERQVHGGTRHTHANIVLCSYGYSGCFGLKEVTVCLYVQRGRRSLCRSGLCSRRSCCSHWVLLCLSSCTKKGEDRSVCVCVFCMKVSVMMM